MTRKRTPPILIVLTFLVLALSANAGADEKWMPVDGHRSKMTTAEGYCNCVFAASEIQAGHERSMALKTKFTAPEAVFARCYFSSPIGPIGAPDFWHEIWIDGKPVRITHFENPPAPEWDQISIWISKEEYRTDLEKLEPGEHEIIIQVWKNAPLKTQGKKHSGFGHVRLSKGIFHYSVPTP